MNAKIKIQIEDVKIKDRWSDLEPMFKALQESEQEMFDKSELWGRIKRNYLRHIKYCQLHQQGTCLIAIIEDEPVGFIFGYLEEPDDSRIEVYTGKELYVSDGYVYPKYRKQGIYKLLNEQLEAKYLEMGIRRVLRFTLASNLRMQQFLKKEGYTATRFMYEKWFDNSGENILPLGLTHPETK